jgi:hypothetical protein
MPTVRAAPLMSISLVLLAAAAFPEVPAAIFAAAGVEEASARAAGPFVTAGLAAVGFLLIAVATVAVLRRQRSAARARPYLEALRSFATELGRPVTHADGVVGVDLQRDGQRVEVRIDPAVGRVTLRGSLPARQSLAWTAMGAEAPAAARDWRPVEGAGPFRHYAELPLMARPLLADPALTEAVDLYFRLPEARSVTHTLAGMVIEAALPAPEDTSALVRAATEVAFRLRRVNG